MAESTADFLAVIAARHAKRAFLSRAVPRAVLVRVLAAAGNAPSTRNGQPWRVSVVTGAAREALSQRLCAELDKGVAAHHDYANRLPGVDPVAEARAGAANSGVLRAFGAVDEGRAARRDHLRRNLMFYGAPVAMVFHLPPGAVAGTFLELGLFVQNVMLGLVALGLGSCPQASVAGYPDVVREQLGLPPDRIVVCTLSVGYPDEAAAVNAFVPDRAALTEYVRWHDQPPSRAETSCGDAVLMPTPASATCSQRRDLTS